MKDSIWIAVEIYRGDDGSSVMGPFTSVDEFEKKLLEIVESGKEKNDIYIDSFWLREYKLNSFDNNEAVEYYYGRNGKQFDIWARNKEV